MNPIVIDLHGNHKDNEGCRQSLLSRDQLVEPEINLDVLYHLFHVLSHLKLGNSSAKREYAKNPRVLLLLIGDVHVVHRPTNLCFGLSANIAKNRWIDKPFPQRNIEVILL